MLGLVLSWIIYIYRETLSLSSIMIVPSTACGTEYRALFSDLVSQFGKICHYLNVYLPLWVWYRNYFRNNDGGFWIQGICSASPSPGSWIFPLPPLAWEWRERRMHLFQGWAVMPMILYMIMWVILTHPWTGFLSKSSKKTGPAPHATPYLLSANLRISVKGRFLRLFVHIQASLVAQW